MAPPSESAPPNQGWLAIIESLARAARQVGLYGLNHPMAAASLENACSLLLTEAEKESIKISASEKGLFWNQALLPLHLNLVAHLHNSMRKRLIAAIHITAEARPEGVGQLLAILAEDPKTLLSEGGAMRLFSRKGPFGVRLEEVDFSVELHECEATWLEYCRDIDAQVIGPLQEIVESCLFTVKCAGPDRMIDKLHAVLSAFGSAAQLSLPGEKAQSSEESVAATVAHLIQEAGELSQSNTERERQLWRESIARQLEALGPKWRAAIFRAPSGVSPGYPEMLTLIAREMDPCQAVSLVLDYPAAISAEPSEGLARLLNRIMSDPERMNHIEPLLHEQSLLLGISEAVYQNVVGVILSRAGSPTADPVKSQSPTNELKAVSQDPEQELPDALENIGRNDIARSRIAMLLELPDVQLTSTQASIVLSQLVETAQVYMQADSNDDLLDILNSIYCESQRDDGLQLGRAAAARRALARLGDTPTVNCVLSHLERCSPDQQSELIDLLGSLGDPGMEALLTLVERRGNEPNEHLFLTIAQHDLEGFPYLGRLLTQTRINELPATIQILLKAGYSSALGQIRSLMSHPAVSARMELVHILREHQASDSSTLLLQMLQDSDPGVRLATIRALADTPSPESVPVLCDLIESTSPFGWGPALKEAAAFALGAIGMEAAVPTLTEMLCGKRLLSLIGDPRPRIAAAIALGKIASPEALKALEMGKHNPKQAIREACRQALLAATGSDQELVQVCPESFDSAQDKLRRKEPTHAS